MRRRIEQILCMPYPLWMLLVNKGWFLFCSMWLDGRKETGDLSTRNLYENISLVASWKFYESKENLLEKNPVQLSCSLIQHSKQKFPKLEANPRREYNFFTKYPATGNAKKCGKINRTSDSSGRWLVIELRRQKKRTGSAFYPPLSILIFKSAITPTIKAVSIQRNC